MVANINGVKGLSWVSAKSVKLSALTMNGLPFIKRELGSPPFIASLNKCDSPDSELNRTNIGRV